MTRSFLFTLFFILISRLGIAQIYPSYGPEIDVTINGLTFDAMEPNLSYDGNYLFFNNLNDGITTRLYYASKVNDSTFTFVGEVNGTNQMTSPHLDAVADVDSSGYFLWTSTRDYPTIYENLHYGFHSNGTVSNIGRVYGNFNIYQPGWLIMDHGITADGQQIFINNANFSQCVGPGVCVTYMQIAEKVNDSTFNVIPNSDGILTNINDSSNYVYYASCISPNKLELYYTRYPTGTVTISTPIDIVVAVRDTELDTFSTPQVLFSSTPLDIVEAPTFSSDMSRMYYHKKFDTTHVIKLRYRNTAASVEHFSEDVLLIYPNPAKNIVKIETGASQIVHLKIFDRNMKLVLDLGEIDQEFIEVDISSFSSGTYYLTLSEGIHQKKITSFIKE